MEGRGCPTCAICEAEEDIEDSLDDWEKLNIKLETASDPITFSKTMRKIQGLLEELSGAFKNQEEAAQKMRARTDTEATGQLYEQARTYLTSVETNAKRKGDEIDRALTKIYGKPRSTYRQRQNAAEADEIMEEIFRSAR